MQIHELNNFTGTLGAGAYLAVDDGTDTGKLSTQQLLAATEARIDNLVSSVTVDSEVIDARVVDGVTYPSLHAAINTSFTDLKEDIDEFTEPTRNLNTSEMGQWGNASDGNIYSRNDKYFGMASFIPITAGKNYTFSFSGLSSSNSITWTYMFVNDLGAVVSRSGYSNINTRTITAPTGATKLNAFCTSTSTITVGEGAYMQIEEGDYATSYISPVSAIDAILRSEINEFPTYHFSSVIGAIIQNAEKYFDEAYNGNPNLVYDSMHGLFTDSIYSDNVGEENHPAIVCSQFVWAMMKYITWDNSRYVKDTNHVGQFCFTSDGVNQDTQDGEPYPYSYYWYVNNGTHGPNDIPSYDYMQSSEMYRYALNHGYAYEIKERYPQLRPGDVIFSIDENSSFYKKITHSAFCVYTGFDDNRVILLESNTFAFDNLLNIGAGVRNAPLLSNQYGARFPLHELPHTAKLVEHGKTISIQNTQNYTIGEILSQSHEKGFYTLIIKGDLPHDKIPQIAVLYDNIASGQYYRILNNGDLHVVFWYAPRTFTSVNLGINTGANVNLESVTLIKGYVPIV